MPKLNVTKPFKYSPNGVDVIEYCKGEHEVSERCPEIAVAEGWGKLMLDVKRQPRKHQPDKEHPDGTRDQIMSDLRRKI